MFEIALIGAGNMAEEIGKRLIRYGGINSEQIIATHYKSNAAREFQNRTGIRTILDSKEAVKSSNTSILCVRPQQLERIIKEIYPIYSNNNNLLVSTVVGVSVFWLSKKMQTKSVIHFHPTSLLMVTDKWNPGVSLLLPHPEVSEDILKRFILMFNKTIGEIVVVNDEQILKSLIYIVGNSPAYIIRIIKGFVDSVQRDVSNIDIIELYRYIIKSIFIGIVDEGKDPVEIIKRIATKGGVTEAGLDFLENKNISLIVEELKKVTIHRIKEIESNISK